MRRRGGRRRVSRVGLRGGLLACGPSLRKSKGGTGRGGRFGEGEGRKQERGMHGMYGCRMTTLLFFFFT